MSLSVPPLARRHLQPRLQRETQRPHRDPQRPPRAFPALRTLLMLALLAAWLHTLPAIANEAAPEAADPALEARMQAVTSELRCLVCQNQTIADSQADLAVDLRREVRDLLRQGKSEHEIIDYMTARYGDFVLYRPPMKPTTMLLWYGPALLLAVGIAALVLVLRRRSRLAAENFEPDPDDEADERGGAPGRPAAPTR